MMTPETHSAVGDWLAVAEGRKPASGAVFAPFITAWIGFNALHAAEYPGGDQNGVRRFATSQRVSERHRNLLNQADYANAVRVLAEKGIAGRRGRLAIDHLENCEAVFDCVYQVRCNLFHGSKRPDKPA